MRLLLLSLISTFLIGISSVQSAQGLNFKYYEGNWSLLPDFNAMTPVKSGTVSAVNLDQRRKENQYAFLFQGYINIPAAGNYTFETLSDDGSKLYIGNYDNNTVSLVNNDGVHGNQIRTGTIALNAGLYPIALTYFQTDGGQTWEVYWSSNTGIPRQKIPDNVLSTSNGATSFAAPSSGSGLNFSYYEGTWNTLPDFSSLTPVKTGTTANVSLSPRNREKQYGLVWQGNITIPADGSYTFETYSDDGSKLYIGNSSTPLVNNDGLHGSQTRSGTISLSAGVYPITMSYFQNDGNQTWEVYWSSNSGISRQKIPDNAFSGGSGGGTAASGGTGLNYNYYEGTWSNMPDFNSLTPVKSGTTANIDLGPRNREKQYAFVWQGNINIPTSGNYTFETYSDDGSKVYVGSTSTALVNNDGLHSSQTRSGAISLNAGLNPITITYFQNDGNQTMELYWSSNTGIGRQKIPDNAFSGSASVVAPVETPPASAPSAPSVPSAPSAPSAPVETPPVVSIPDSYGSGGLTGANNYYFSSTNGDDSRSSDQAKNPSTPWRTIGKLNSIMSGLQAGDAVLFNRGDVFDGSINMSVSGGGGSPIIFSSYGNGNKPVINGLSTLSNWTSIGNGVWQASCQSADRINMVAMNGVAQAMGRYPNITEPNRGYNTLDSHAGTSMISDNQLTGSVNYTGAEVVIRKNNWVLDRCLITNHSGNAIYYNSPTSHEPADGYGYFIQNSPQTLDQLGEWYFDPNQKVLKMYFGGNNPSSYDIKASTVNNLMLISNKSNFLIDNLAFVGGDDNGLRVEYAQNVRVQYCSFDLSGTEGVSGISLTNFSFEGNSINHSNNDAFEIGGSSNTTVRSNTVKNSGLLVGMGGSGNQQYNGIYVEGSNNTIELNNIENTGYSGITFSGESVLIKNNYINNFCLTIEDGGGVYTWGDLNKYNRKVQGNIILNGIGAFEGTTYPFSTGATGIFHDDESANVEMTDNTIANCSRAGVFFHNSHDMVMRNNTVFNNRTQITMVHDPISINHPIRNITLDNNILFSKLPSQFILEMGTLGNDLGSFGNFTNNYYDRPVDDNGVIYTYFKDGSGTNQFTYYDLNGFKTAFSSYDQQSKSSPLKIPSYIVNGTNGGNRYNNGIFNININDSYCLSSPGRCAVSWINGILDGGALQVSFDGSSGAINTVGNYMNIGAVQAGRNYQIKFSLVGSKPGKTLKAFMLDGSTYEHISDTKYFQLGTSRTDNEFLFTPTNSSNRVLIAFEINGPDCPYWMDNMQVYDVNTSVTNPDDYIRFVYNPTNSAQSFSLSGNYVDARNNFYTGSINLSPFSSAVLIRQGGQDAATATERSANVASAQLVPEAATDSKSLSVNLSPNPTRNTLQIDLNAPEGTQKSTLSINSIAGITLKTIPVNATTKHLSVDVSTWSTGTYVVSYICDGHTIYKKFVKQ